MTSYLSDTPALALSAEPCANNATWVNLGPVSLLTHHRAVVGALVPGVGKFRNARYVGRSITTTKLLNAQGFRDRPALPEDRFSAMVTFALSLDWSASLVDVSVASAWLEARGEGQAFAA